MILEFSSECSYLVDDQEDVQPEIGGPLLLHYFSCANYAAMVRNLVITL